MRRAALPHLIRSLAVGAGMLLSLAATSPAAGIDFDARTGEVTLEAGSLSWGLDTLQSRPAGLPGWILSADGSDADEAVLAERLVGEDRALEGGGALALGGDVDAAVFHLLDAASRFDGRRVRFSYWQRFEGTRLQGEIRWYAGDVPAAIETRNASALWLVGRLIFVPSGRATSDGWVEMVAGPVDFSLGGRVPAAILSIRDLHAADGDPGVSVGRDDSVRALLDALEIVDVGPSQVPASDCRLPQERDRCGAEGMCWMGRCVDGASIVGPPLPAAIRSDYVRRRIFELGRFDGSRRALSQMSTLESAIPLLEDLERPRELWPMLEVLVERLADAHARPPLVNRLVPPGTGVCLGPGTADLLSPAREAPLVFGTGSGSVAALLDPGDVLVQADGLDIDEWRALAEPRIDFPGEDGAREVVTSLYLMGAAAEAGSVLTFERCPAADGSGTACASATETVTVDLRTLIGERVWSNDIPGFIRSQPSCDLRFVRAADLSPPAGYSSIGWSEVGGVRHLLFNGLPEVNPGGGGSWSGPVEEALSDGPARLVVDIRTGYGGSSLTTSFLASWFSAPSDYPAIEHYPQTDLALDGAFVTDLRACSAADEGWRSCGAYDLRGPEEYERTGAGAAAGSRVAILVANDVSGAEVFARLLLARPAPTRVFGPGPTWGGFGYLLGLPAHLREESGGSFQVTDSVFGHDGASAPSPFLSGAGIAPDVVVRQTQSDVLAGTDTVLEAARAWVSQ